LSPTLGDVVIIRVRRLEWLHKNDDLLNLSAIDKAD